MGEAQAGIVYQSDAQLAKDKVSIVTIPPEMNVIAEYPIAAAAVPAHPGLARAWIDWVLSPGGQQALQNAGFPPASSKGGG
jgi:molybdate transport system substrate-binding protein